MSSRDSLSFGTYSGDDWILFQAANSVELALLLVVYVSICLIFQRSNAKAIFLQIFALQRPTASLICASLAAERWQSSVECT